MAFDPFAQAQQHPLRSNTPAVDFFAGALLGNGGLGVVVTTRPDGIMLHLGHNSVWDIRVAEAHTDQIGTFADIFAKVAAIPASLGALEEDEWYKAYTELMQANYQASYPRPFPCGTILLGLDRRHCEVIGHELDIATGTCRVQLMTTQDQSDCGLVIWVDPHTDAVWMRCENANGHAIPSPFERIRIMPDPTTPAEFPAYTVHAQGLGFWQRLPSQVGDVHGHTTPPAYWQGFDPGKTAASGIIPEHPDDQAVSVAVAVSSQQSRWQPQTSYGTPRPIDALERALIDSDAFVAQVVLTHGRATDIAACEATAHANMAEYVAADTRRIAHWQHYWRLAGVRLADELLERTWYHNLYFFACAVSARHTCPGLFANWSYRDIGTAWHGDYHMNYNTQQPFWVCFSSNRIEQHFAYVRLIEHLLPISERWAQQYYGLRGAYFPHSAYPTTMHTMPYPVPTWGWEICETPWSVQSLWWHYRYTLDDVFLRQRAFGPIRAAVQFLADYMQRPEAWWDGRYHIYPTVSPELYGLTPGLHKNADCLVDLTLTKFVFNAYLEAVQILGISDTEHELVAAVTDILVHFPTYPTAETAQGTVFVSVPHEDPQVVYNVPSSTTTIFPGEEHGLHSEPDAYALALRTLMHQRNEGGNELVFLNMQAARMGVLDLAKFKRQIAYCLLPNGTCTDMVLQVHGRYRDDLPFDFMADMGIWFENFALPAVINECLMQSYTGEIRLFPNWPLDCAAEFEQLRAVGAHLVSAGCRDGVVTHVHITSEHGGQVKVWSPWHTNRLLERTLQAGERWELTAEASV